MQCVHCHGDLVLHESGGAKAGALHCYSCGCCFIGDGKTPRDGVPVCALAQEAPVSIAPPPDPDAPAAEEATVSAETVVEAKPVTPRRRARR